MQKSRFSGPLFGLAAFLVISAASPCSGEETALDRYVAAPDANYRYELLSTIPGDHYTAYLLEMTSQEWRTPEEVDRPVWKHWLTIVRPDQVTTNIGLLVINGGSNDRPPPTRVSPMLTNLAVGTGSVLSELRMVPNQPLTFAGETKKRSEDAIVAYSWDKYLRTGDETWPLQLPMTKAAVRAMDTITTFCRSAQGGGITVDKFVVGGASKRGWTTWMTAAVDKRVIAIAPVVIDLLNMEPSFDHQYRSYGFWAPAVHDFEDMGIMRWVDTPQFAALMKIVDPYAYRDRLGMLKFIVNSTGDQFFLPDSFQFYFDGLPGENYLRYVPNTDHSLKGAEFDLGASALALYESIISDTSRPHFTWRFESDGTIRVETQTQPSEVRLWWATNPTARDFRLQTIGPSFASAVLEYQPSGVYVGVVPTPKQGWTAYFMEMTFPAGGSEFFKFGTGVRVTPVVLPFGPPPRPGRGAPTSSSDNLHLP
jgi:PhoPQ-activated pathogenicity-related protein